MLLVALLAEPTLDLVPSYYTLAEIAQTAQKAGVDVKIDPACQKDSYGAALKGVPWGIVVEALRADGTLEVGETDGKWRIVRNAQTARREAAEAQNYLRALSTAYLEPYQAARAMADRIYLNPEEERASAASKLKVAPDATPASKFALDLTRSTFYDSERKYANVSMPVRAAPMIAQGPGAPPVAGPLWSLMPWILPKGAPDEAKKWFFLQVAEDETPEAEAERKKILNAIDADLRWHLDPQTGAASYVLAVNGPFQTMQGRLYEGFCRQGIMIEPLYGHGYLPSLDLAKITGEARFKSLKNRKIASEQLLASEPSLKVEGETVLPEGTFADTMLRMASKRGTNLLFRPSSFFNVRLPKKSYKTFAEALKAGSSADAVRKDSIARIPARIGVLENTNVPALALDPRLTFAQVGNVVTMTDDLRFLERFVDGRPILSEAVANDSLNEKPILPIRVLNEIGTLQPQSWRSGAIASAVLDFGDPTEIYPFAVMYKSSPLFRGAVDALKRKGSARIPWTTVPETDRRILANAILAVERVFADRYSHSSPSAGAAHIMNLDPASLEIVVSRVNTSVGLEYDFRVLRDGEPAWGAHLRNVNPVSE